MTFREDAGVTAALLQDFADRALRREGPVLVQPPLAELTGRLELHQLIEDGGLEGRRLAGFLERYLAASTRLHHPRYMAHQVAVPEPQGALAALVDGFTSNPMAIYEMGPAAAAVENAVLDWMLGRIGWGGHDGGSPPAGGVLTHGGSLANLTAMLCARAEVAPSAWRDGTPQGLVLVCTPGSHYSIARAAAILGLGASNVRHAPTDDLGRLDAESLPGWLDGLHAEGKRPLAVVANGCSTALGLYDSIGEIASVCRSRGVWLHVDGAHGASVLLSPRLRHLLAGIEHAQSVVWDGHKMLRSPLLAAAVLVRDARSLDGAFQQDASYLFHDKEKPGIDALHRTVECTKAALGLKIFFALAHHGERAIAAHVERQTDLATAAAALLRSTPSIEVAAEPQSNIVCFRVAGSDELQLDIRKHLTGRGDFYVSTAEVLGRRWLRLALMNPATTIDDVEALAVSCLALAAGAARP
jgi:L-2,4-diaminobutyrate decarboxylase